MNILITGGQGCIGSHLSLLLLNQGYQLSYLTRNPTQKNDYHWDIDKNTIDERCIANIDCIIHLAGANIAEKRWTKKRKNEIVDSRVKSLQLIYNLLNVNKHTVKTIVSASAVGYYGAITTEKIFTEEDKNYNDFIGNTCEKWEKELDKFKPLNIEVTKIRTGIVLAKNCGALPKLLLPLKFFVAPVLGFGKQWMPWIHMDDLCSIYLWIIANNKSGVYNAVSDEHVNNLEFTNAIKEQFQRSSLKIRLPVRILKLMLGEMSCLLLEGSRVSNDKIIKEGYIFKYSKLKNALATLT